MIPTPTMIQQPLMQQALQPVANPDHAKAWSQQQGNAHRVFHEMAARIRQRYEAGQRTGPEVRNFLRHPLVRLSAALRALGGAPDQRTALALRDRVNAWSTDFLAVRWRLETKPSGGLRVISDLPLELKAVHYMLSAALEAQFTPSAALYGVACASRDDAAIALKSLQNEGFNHLAKGDIRECFQSVAPDALYQLPLPKEVIRRTLDTRQLNFTERTEARTETAFAGFPCSSYSYHGHNPSEPQGLMQGSPASSIILAWLLNGIPTGTDQAVILCFDNVAVAAQDRERCRAMMDNLVEWFATRCPAGPLELCQIAYASPGDDPLEFLGYSFDPDRVEPGISQKSLKNLEVSLGEAEARDMDMSQLWPNGIWQALRDFRRGFPAATDDDLLQYVETSADIVNRRGNPLVAHLHRHIFAPKGTAEGDALAALLDATPRPKKRRKR